MKRKFWIFLAFWMSLLVMATGCQMLNPPYTLRGARIEPPPRAADFTLTAQDGKPFRLSEQAGKVVLIFFGYTACPDVCPTTMATLKKVRAAAQAKERVQVVFITVDPERDTSERLGVYMSNFDATFVGLTGTNDQLDVVWKAYGVYHAKQPSASAASYTVDHSAYIYAIDARGNLRETFSFDDAADKITQDVNYLLSEKP